MSKKKYFYTYEEYSQDTRSYEVESDVELTKKEIQNIALGCDMTDGYTYLGGEKDKRFNNYFFSHNLLGYYEIHKYTD